MTLIDNNLQVIPKQFTELLLFLVHSCRIPQQECQTERPIQNSHIELLDNADVWVSLIIENADRNAVIVHN